MLKLNYDIDLHNYTLEINEKYIVGAWCIEEAKEKLLEFISHHIDAYINERLVEVEVEPTVQASLEGVYRYNKRNN